MRLYSGGAGVSTGFAGTNRRAGWRRGRARVPGTTAPSYSPGGLPRGPGGPWRRVAASSGSAACSGGGVSWRLSGGRQGEGGEGDGGQTQLMAFSGYDTFVRARGGGGQLGAKRRALVRRLRNVGARKIIASRVGRSNGGARQTERQRRRVGSAARSGAASVANSGGVGRGVGGHGGLARPSERGFSSGRSGTDRSSGGADEEQLRRFGVMLVPLEE